MSHDQKHTLEQVVKFLDSQQLGRVATLGPLGQPQLANVAFSQNNKLELIIGTSGTSRKAKNILRDGRVAFETTDPVRRFTFQFDGTARILTPEEFEKRAKAHYKKLPGSLPFKDIKGQVHFLLTPTWVRFSDCSVGPWQVSEYTF